MTVVLRNRHCLSVKIIFTAGINLHLEVLTMPCNQHCCLLYAWLNSCVHAGQAKQQEQQRRKARKYKYRYT